MRTMLSLAALALAGMAAAPSIGERRWRHRSEAMFRDLRATRDPWDQPVNESDLADVPAPVAKDFRRALPVGKPAVISVRVEQTGQMLINDRWRDFSAVEQLSTLPPSFLWDARIRVAPLVYTFVRDAYLDGIASMQASLAGLFRVTDQRGGDALNAGALYRYLAEATSDARRSPASV